MKRILLAGILVICFLLSGCRNEGVSGKMCRIEIRSEDDPGVIQTFEGMTQKEVHDFFHEDEWAENNADENQLVPEYRITVYQEKTKTLIPSDDDNQYEKITEYVTYKDSACVKVTVNSDLIKSREIPDGLLTYYYTGSDEFFKQLQ